MRHLINKHYDTTGGLLGHPTNVSSHPKPPVSKEDETMKQTIRKSTFDALYKNILTVNFAENWELLETNNKAKNPLMMFKTDNSAKLIKLCKSFVNNSNDIYDIEVGAIKGFIISFEMYCKAQRS